MVELDLYLGIDLSTQSCKVQVFDASLKQFGEAKVQFDEDLKEKVLTDYGVKITDGVVRESNGRVWSPTRMWAAALDLALKRLHEKVGSEILSLVKCISGSGQQHGSVYWSKNAEGILSSLSADVDLDKQLAGAFVTEESPIWMDTSGTQECRELEAHVGGADSLSLKTGSRAYERFTAHPIAQFLKSGKGVDCSRISLVSSFGASLLCGKVVDIDHSDGAGMNLMNLDTSNWDADILSFLQEKEKNISLEGVLGKPALAWENAGTICNYFSSKYGFSPSCQVNYWTGDNPSSVVGLGMLLPGDIAISLGTSDTLLAVVDKSNRKALPFGHIFPHPCLEDKLFLMLCYTNGDVTRRAIRDQYAEGNWDTFTSMLNKTNAGNDGQFGLFFSADEITPPLAKRPHVLACSSDTNYVPTASFEKGETYVRGVVEARALAMLSHMKQLGFHSESGRLLMTGGGSNNPAIRQIFSDIFQRQVYGLQSADSAAFGAAVRAMHACKTLDVSTLTNLAEAKEKPNVGPSVYQGLENNYHNLESEVCSSKVNGARL